MNEWLGGLWPTFDRDALTRLAEVWWPAGRGPLIDGPIPADLEFLADIHAACFAQGWSGDEIAALIGAPGTVVAVARRASPFGTRRPVGFVIVRVAADEAEVISLAVHPHWRRRGVGQDLVAAVMRRLYADRVAALFLEVDAANAAAVALYRRLGFSVVGERRGYYASSPGDGRALVMRHDLR